MEDVKLQAKIQEFLSVDHGYGYGYGYGSGYGYGDGSGYGYGSGDGSGDGSLSGLNGETIYMIDEVPTIIRSVHKNVAKGFILQSDLQKTPCYIVKGNNLFAHSSSLREAMTALSDKMFDDMPVEERITQFIKAHPDKDKHYPNQDLFDWHHRLTGSCLAGRKAFVKDRDLTLEGETTVADFISLTRNAYGSSVIRELEKTYETSV